MIVPQSAILVLKPTLIFVISDHKDIICRWQCCLVLVFVSIYVDEKKCIAVSKLFFMYICLQQLAITKFRTNSQSEE